MRNDTPPPCDSSFYRPCGAGGGNDPKRCVVIRIGRSDWAPASTRAGRHDQKRLHFTSGQMVPSCGIVSLRAP